MTQAHLDQKKLYKWWRENIYHTFVLVLAADHEAGDVLQEEQRHTTLAAQLNEVRGLRTKKVNKYYILE